MTVTHQTSTSFIYDAFGRIAEEDSTGSVTHVLYQPDGSRFATIQNGSIQNYFMPMVNGMVEMFNSSGEQYVRHADWLGSSRLATDPNGNAVYDRAYAPYGETYADLTGTSDRFFTGNTQDAIKGQTGIYDFLLREHSAGMGRWLVPDPAGLAAVDITNPQTWNRYAYVGNNPLNTIDPLGLDNDCGGPCTPQLFSYGNCYATITYHSETAPWGGTYDTPAFNSFCHGSGSVRSPGPLWTVVDWDDVHGTGPKRNCNLTPLLCYKKPAGTPPQPNPAPVDCSKEPCVSSNKPPNPPAPPTPGQIQAACTIIAINANNGFGSAGGDSATASLANGIVFQQYTQSGRLNTMNPSSPNLNALMPLAAPGIFVQNTYYNCLGGH